ncbi:MAG TPA: HAMP domain-containing sensor histidine kinase [Gemmatimonadales bacterium]|nr:HAMP domain-containing sensor histidine kinase [Gemmatimonadales bacterium]
MSSIRSRLTVWYAIALLVSVGAFGAALYFERQRSSIRELDARLSLEGTLAAQYFITFQRQLGQTLEPGQTPTLAINQVGGYLSAVQDHIIIFDPDRGPIYRNAAALRVFSGDSLNQLVTAVAGVTSGSRVETGVVGITGAGTFRYARVPIPGIWLAPASMVVAAPVGAVPFGAEQLLRAMLVIAPVILVGSIGLGYVLADTSLRPLEGMVDELEAITDGRSLHRRVAPVQAEELARLANTMNRMLARLEESFGSLRRFTADASHELKTPLMVLRAGVERAMNTPKTPTEALQPLEEVLEEIHRMSEMVENLLTLARADEGGARLAVEPTDLRDLLGEASETAGILGEENAITVRTEVPGDPVIVPIDRSRIRQLLLNLVTNAIKYTPAGGKVSLGLVDQGEAAAIVVGDNGIGIPTGDLPHIFDRFYRVDAARSRTGERPGTGLGLAITKWIAEAHGGQISVQSRLGRGTVFTVTLPKHPGANPAALEASTLAGEWGGVRAAPDEMPPDPGAPTA